MKQILLLLLGAAVFVAIVGHLVQNSSRIKLAGILKTASPSPTKTLIIGKKVVNIQIVDTPSTREQGLSGVKSLPSDNGMLFVFELKQVNYSFWMKGMLIPLDMIWISGNKVVAINKNVPFYPPETPNNQLKIYNPGVPYDYALEVNAGFATTNNIKIGDFVTL